VKVTSVRVQRGITVNLDPGGRSFEFGRFDVGMEADVDPKETPEQARAKLDALVIKELKVIASSPFEGETDFTRFGL
jgi:hypothetical protein